MPSPVTVPVACGNSVQDHSAVDFYAMLAYAKTRGWMSDDELRIRAHVIRS